MEIIAGSCCLQRPGLNGAAQRALNMMNPDYLYSLQAASHAQLSSYFHFQNTRVTMACTHDRAACLDTQRSHPPFSSCCSALLLQITQICLQDLDSKAGF